MIKIIFLLLLTIRMKFQIISTVSYNLQGMLFKQEIKKEDIIRKLVKKVLKENRGRDADLIFINFQEIFEQKDDFIENIEDLSFQEMN